jgi:hypothetical protein
MEAYAALGIDLVEVTPIPVALVSQLGEQVNLRLAQLGQHSSASTDLCELNSA